MPEISSFYGIVITLNIRDHNPPHIHARYAEYEAIFDIRMARIIAGKLPGTARQLVIKWIKLHTVELLEDWNRAIRKEQPFKITPLQ